MCSRGLSSPKRIGEGDRDHTSNDQDHPHDARKALANFEQAERPGLVQIVELRQPRGTELLPGLRAGLEVLDALPQLISEIPRELARRPSRIMGHSSSTTTRA
jgi:hypothetical protein